MRKPLLLLLAGLCLVHSSSIARVWTEAASGRKVDAEFVSSADGKVLVQMKGGGKVSIDLVRLAPEDRSYVEERVKSSAKPAAAAASKVEDFFEDTPKLKAEEIPASGEERPDLATVDAAIRNFMVEKGIGAVTFALSKNGKILHDRAFGWADPKLKEPLKPGVKMRVASMTKPVVMAAIKTLITDGKLKAEDLVFPLLELGQFQESKGCDERWQKVTIQNLLDHKGGWDRDVSGDFTGLTTQMCEMYDVKLNELTPEHMLRFGLTRKLDFAPGERYAYCNYGYIVLVRVIEKVSGQKFMDYLHATVAKTSGAESFSASASDARDRQAGEVWYSYHPEYTKPEVPLRFRTDARDGAGILACTAADYCRFLENYSVLGNQRKPGAKYRGSFAGSHPGVTAICSQRVDGINYAIICNRRGVGSTDWNGDLRKVVDAELEKVAAGL
ncbi:serine hydrolase [Brevifollis gellanilyticus]|uniref:serine hydrolase n=1 Tax=Brevifollis gellanilyticus TaxID=748831 RepID=UPI00147883CB|nr:serine hydrolase [Brevifollis gellanilyticus]